MSSRLARTRHFAIALIAVALLAGACGAGPATDGVASLSDPGAAESPDPTASVELSREEALLAFTACLRENGVDIDDPTVDADGNVQLAPPSGRQGGEEGPGDQFREAREACADLLDDAALGFGGDFDRTELEDDLVSFAECMRENGYDMPDPDFSSFGPGAGGGGGPFGAIDPDDPSFQTASEACGDILAGFGRGPGGGRPGGGGGNG